jgi:glycosyltransferase involved in cell wall biosynthesis
MRIALIADVFPPLRSSGAVQLRDLSREFARQGHEVTVLIPAPTQAQPCLVEDWQGIRIVRLRSPQTKDVGYVRRTLAEFLMPHAMLRRLRRSALADERWDGVVWYSPTIFLGPMARALKQQSRCRGYLIVRDIFPEWAVDMGLMQRGPAYWFFKLIERYQYAAADVIGVQTAGNLSYLAGWDQKNGRHVEVLQNWLDAAPDTGCSIRVDQTALAGRKIYVYAGNMGIAQGMGILLDLAKHLQQQRNIGFLFVGRGSDAQKLREQAQSLQLDNVAFFDEIEPEEIPGLYAQCHAGIVALDRRHKTHNIPGKFLSYMHSGLPVLAIVNPSNDLIELINTYAVGEVCSDYSVDTLERSAMTLMDRIDFDTGISDRCQTLGAQMFAPQVAAIQIVRALQA